MPNEDGTPTPEELAQKQEADAKAKAEADKKAALDAETKGKEQHLLNINKAIEEAETDLQEKRRLAKEAASKPAPVDKPVEEIPQIDETAPESKAWNKKINDKVDPLAQQNEAEKAEIRKFALSKFLADKPALAADPTKVKELMDVYAKIATNTGKTQEGVLIDLGKAFGAVYSEQLINTARTGRVERAKEMQLFSDPAVDKGATGYAENQVRRPNLTAEDRKQLAAWGMTEEQYFKSLEKKPEAE